MIPGIVASSLRQPAQAGAVNVTNTAPLTPTVTTTAVTNFDQSTAQLNMTSSGATVTGFQYRPSGGSFTTVMATSVVSSLNVSGLQNAQVYEVQAIATNKSGRATFTISINILNDSGSYRFEYGPGGGAYNQFTPTTPISGNGLQTLTASVTGLSTDTPTWKVRLAVFGSQGTQYYGEHFFGISPTTVNGSTQTFTTYGLRTFSTGTPGNLQTWTAPSVGNGKPITQVFNVLLVGGGGAGSADFGSVGGGGAGEVRTFAGPYTFSNSISYVCGAGGGVNASSVAQNGQFSALYIPGSTLEVIGGFAGPVSPNGTSSPGGMSGNFQPGGSGFAFSFAYSTYAGGGGGGAGGPGGPGFSDTVSFGYGGNGGVPVTVAAQYGGGTYAGGGGGAGSNGNGIHYTHPGSGGQPILGGANAQPGFVRFQYWGP